MPPEKRKRRPRDANQLAKAIVDIATGETEDREPTSGPVKRRWHIIDVECQAGQ